MPSAACFVQLHRCELCLPHNFPTLLDIYDTTFYTLATCIREINMSLKFSSMVSMCNARVSIYTIQFDTRTTQIHSQYNSITNAIVYDHLLNIIIAEYHFLQIHKIWVLLELTS